MEDIDTTDAKRAYLNFLYKGLFTPLPNITGVKTLTGVEIRKDIREIEKLFGNADSDNESVCSDDVVNSSFPVRPRKSIRGPRRHSQVVEDFSDSEQNEEFLDRMMEYFKTVEENHKEIMDIEKVRESLEVKYQAVKDYFLMRLKRFDSLKKSHGNYFRILQNTGVRSLQLYSLYNLRNAVLCDLVMALRTRKSALVHLESDAKLASTTNNGKGSKGKGQVTDNSDVSVLKVKVEHGAVAHEVIIYKGQTVATGMGEATVVKILPGQLKIVLQLGFGLMYSHLHGFVGEQVKLSASLGYHGKNPDTLTTKNMFQRWTNCEKELHLPCSYAQKVAAFVGTHNKGASDDKSSAVSQVENIYGLNPNVQCILGKKSPLLVVPTADVSDTGTETSEEVEVPKGNTRSSAGAVKDSGHSANLNDSVMIEEEILQNSNSLPSLYPENAIRKPAWLHTKSHCRDKDLLTVCAPLLYTPLENVEPICDKILNGNQFEWPTMKPVASAKDIGSNISVRAFGGKNASGFDISTDLSVLKRAYDCLKDQVADAERRQYAVMNKVESAYNGNAIINQCMIENRLSLLTARGSSSVAAPARGSKSRSSAKVTNDDANGSNSLAVIAAAALAALDSQTNSRSSKSEDGFDKKEEYDDSNGRKRGGARAAAPLPAARGKRGSNEPAPVKPAPVVPAPPTNNRRGRADSEVESEPEEDKGRKRPKRK